MGLMLDLFSPNFCVSGPTNHFPINYRLLFCFIYPKWTFVVSEGTPVWR